MLTTIWKDVDHFAVPSHGAWRPFLRQLDDLFTERRESARSAVAAGFAPSYDIQETQDGYALSLDVPGVGTGDISIEVQGTKLVVAGERKAAAERQGLGRFGKFHLVFTIPEGTQPDAIEAVHKDGVLTLSVPKPAAVKATKVKIGDGKDKSGATSALTN